MKSIPSNSEPPPGEPGDLPGGPWGAIGPRKYDTSRCPDRNRTEKTRHFEGSGSQSDRENASLRGIRVAIGSRKHVTLRGPGRTRTEKTRHVEGGPGGLSDPENTSLPGAEVAIGRRKHVTSRDPGRARAEKTSRDQGLGAPKGGPQDSPERSKVAL